MLDGNLEKIFAIILWNTVNDENLVGLQFDESANKSVWQNQIHQVCIDIGLICE